MKSEIDDATIDKIFTELDTLKLGKWEFDFVASCQTWWKQRRKLSPKQLARLVEIWRKQNGKP
jgi:hypothetical protein